MVINLLSSIAERRKELTVYRAVGAGRHFVFLLLSLESLLVTFAAGVVSFSLLSASVTYLPGFSEKFFILNYFPMLPNAEEWLIFGISLVTVVVASLIPAVQLFRTDLQNGFRQT